LRHASARNAIERIFGVLKSRFRILAIAPQYSLETQARLPAALCTLHNFIRIHEPHDEPDLLDDPTHTGGGSNLPDRDELVSAATAADLDQPSARREEIADAMWADYQRILRERMEAGSVPKEDEDDEQEEDDEDEEESDGSRMST
ncbi:hypothetical protein HWV62_18834, partial [Athelia sp. TMB]